MKNLLYWFTKRKHNLEVEYDCQKPQQVKVTKHFSQFEKPKKKLLKKELIEVVKRQNKMMIKLQGAHDYIVKSYLKDQRDRKAIIDSLKVMNIILLVIIAVAGTLLILI